MGCGWPINSGQLNEEVPFIDFWFPANVMNPGAVETATKVNQQIAALQMTLDIWSFAPGVQQDVYFTLGLKGGCIDWLKDGAIPRIKIKPIWFQSTTTPAPSPVEYVYWQIAIFSCLIGNGLNRTDPLRGAWQSPVVDQWDLSSGDSTDQERAFKVSQYNGDTTPSDVNHNLLVFQLERHGIDVLDTYADPALLVGVNVQFDSEFANNIAWPTP